MRSFHLVSRLSLTAIAVATLAASPAIASEALNDVIFVPGTGEVAYSGEAATPVPAALADYDAATETPDVSDTESDMIKMAEKMEDPDMQDGIAQMAERMGDTIMRLPIGKFASAIEKARPGTTRKNMRDDATLADLAGRDAEDIPAMIGKESRTAMKMMGGFTKAFASMMPEFEKMGREMEAAMADIKVKRR